MRETLVLPDNAAPTKVAGATKAPDYAFRIGKERKFFVEARKPAGSACQL